MRTFSPCVCYCVLKITSCVPGCRCGLYQYGLRGQRQLFDYQSGLCRMQLDQTTDAAHKLHLQQCVSLCSIDSTSASLPLLFIYFYCWHGQRCTECIFLLIRFSWDSFSECPEYLQEQGQSVGCKIPLDATQRFQPFRTKLYVGGYQTICKNYTDLKQRGIEIYIIEGLMIPKSPWSIALTISGLLYLLLSPYSYWLLIWSFDLNGFYSNKCHKCLGNKCQIEYKDSFNQNMFYEWKVWE